MKRLKADIRKNLTQRWNSINHRCLNKKSPSYKYYGKKGIKNMITVEDLLFLWERDMAYKMLRPSIDRIDPNGNYEIANCRFIELSDNIKRIYEGKSKRGLSVMKNLERANKAKKNIFAMAKRRKANPQEMKIVLIKAAKLWKGEQK